MPRFSASLFLAVLATSFLTANAAPLQFSAVSARANNNNNANFQTACDNGATAGNLVGTALTAVGEIQTNDQTVASQLKTLKAILDATNTAGGQVAAACQAGGIKVNNGNNNNSNNNNNGNNNNNQNSNNNGNNNSNNNNSGNNNNGNNNNQSQTQKLQATTITVVNKVTPTSSSAAATKSA
ncbi:hypothetical protein C8R45DRAFT_377380 [Mycena sanguinolenta]|nr:hypothetical protein C8R45DRAFT_377380 [Mycena sanguinolenta]